MIRIIIIIIFIMIIKKKFCLHKFYNGRDFAGGAGGMKA